MYGQFHNAQSVRTTRTQKASANPFLKSKRPVSGFALITLFVVCLSVSSACLAGSKQPRLAGGNGNAQGR